MQEITVTKLKKLGACDAAVVRFKDIFGSRMRITPKNLDRAEAEMSQFAPIEWLAYRLDYTAASRAENTFAEMNHDAGDCSACKAKVVKFRKLILAHAAKSRRRAQADKVRRVNRAAGTLPADTLDDGDEEP